MRRRANARSVYTEWNVCKKWNCLGSCNRTVAYIAYVYVHTGWNFTCNQIYILHIQQICVLHIQQQARVEAEEEEEEEYDELKRVPIQPYQTEDREYEIGNGTRTEIQYRQK